MHSCREGPGGGRRSPATTLSSPVRCCWHLFWAPNTQQEPVAVLSGQAWTVRGQGFDGPRPSAGLGLPAGWSARAQGQRKVADGSWISLPGGTPSGSRDPWWCLGSGRPT
jgi:hypothetical protein